MKKVYTVLGSVDILIAKKVRAESEDEARRKAAKQFGGLENGMGNGGLYKIITVDKLGEEIFPTDSEVEWNDVIEENPNEEWE